MPHPEHTPMDLLLPDALIRAFTLHRTLHGQKATTPHQVVVRSLLTLAIETAKLASDLGLKDGEQSCVSDYLDAADACKTRTDSSSSALTAAIKAYQCATIQETDYRYSKGRSAPESQVGSQGDAEDEMQGGWGDENEEDGHKEEIERLFARVVTLEDHAPLQILQLQALESQLKAAQVQLEERTMVALDAHLKRAQAELEERAMKVLDQHIKGRVLPLLEVRLLKDTAARVQDALLEVAARPSHPFHATSAAYLTPKISDAVAGLIEDPLYARLKERFTPAAPALHQTATVTRAHTIPTASSSSILDPMTAASGFTSITRTGTVRYSRSAARASTGATASRLPAPVKTEEVSSDDEQRKRRRLPPSWGYN